MRTFLAIILTSLSLSAQIAHSPAFRSDAQFCNQSLSFFNRLTSKPTWSRKQAYDRLIRGLVTSGVWSKLDALYLYAAADTNAALANIVQNSYGCTLAGSPIFTADLGYKGTNGASTYLDTHFDPTAASSPHFIQNSCSMFAWVAVAPTNDAGGIMGIGTTSYILNYTTDTKFYHALLGGAAAQAGFATFTNLFSVSRDSSTSAKSYFGGTFLFDGTGSSSAPAAGKFVQILNDGNGRGDGTTAIVSAGGFGSALSGADNRTISQLIKNYLTDIQIGEPQLKLGYASTAIQDGANNYTPGICRLNDGRILVAYNVGNTVAQENGKVVYQASYDAGASWSSAVDIVTPASGFCYTDTSLTTLANGNPIISVAYATNDSTSSIVVAIKGTVSGSSITWGAPITVGTNTGASTTSYILELADGRLMYPWYNYTGAGTRGVHLIFSSDGGTTWSGDIVAAASGAQDYNESNFVQKSNGDIIGIVRNDGSNKGLMLITSTDNAVTWSAPTRVINNTICVEPARPAIVLLPNGKIFMFERFPQSGIGDLQNGYTYSTDSGSTWATPILYFNALTHSYGQHVYSQGFWDGRSGSMMYVIAQGTFTVAEIDFQQFYLP